MPQPNDLSRSLAALDQDSTLIAVIEMSQEAGWWVGERTRIINRIKSALARLGIRARGLKAHRNPRVRRSMLQLAWRFLRFQKQSALVKWFQTRTADGRMATRKTMILALARKLLIALWRLATTGEVSQGVMLRPAR